LKLMNRLAGYIFIKTTKDLNNSNITSLGCYADKTGITTKTRTNHPQCAATRHPDGSGGHVCVLVNNIIL
ncbi:hypothetical protein, partial [Sulfurirhabdus autotrophica]|uniref:hypothetical protein n=1 Tax=Sulfurirhabdus autotrophica TaxID=1706046 RepID=UPI001CB93D2C